MIYTIEQIEKWLKNNLSNERYIHSLGAAESARELAKRYHLDENKAYFAGLIHDCAKCLTKDNTMRIIKSHLTLEEEEILSPKTHHAPVGAYIAKNEFGVTDKDVLSSIRWHTVGKIGMSDFEKIIFIADKIETKTRPPEMYEPIVQALDESLDKALLVCYKATIKSLVDRNLRIFTSTIDIYNSLL